ncbi:MAG TPA: type II CAAX endopeptidase family protein [Rhizomicrobium sp.]|nr:type II CAAX endopeptidase family protein [Rhizomicrobium sp.]
MESSPIGVMAYLVITFGLAWGSWSLLLPAHTMGGSQLLLIPGAFAPAIASFVVRRWITREGFADAGLGLHFAKWRYYVIGWLLPFVVLGVIVACAPPLGLGAPDFAATYVAHHLGGTNLPTALRDHIAVAVPLLAVVSSLIATPFLFGEEFGWRGYLQLRLFAGRPTLAAVATGIIWGLWHWPLIMRGAELPGTNRLIATASFCVATILLSVIFGWLWRRSGSVWCTSLAHSAMNKIGGSLIGVSFGVIGLAALGLVSIAVMLGEKRSE